MKKTAKTGILFAIIAAALYAINSPISKIILDYLPPTVLAGFLYLGAGLGMTIVACFRQLGKQKSSEKSLSKKELPYTIAMILLDILALILLLMGLNATTAENASLLNNFEIVATAIIALCLFRESISPRLWGGIVFVTLSCAILSVGDITQIKFSIGSLYILLACVCWGFENNCTRKLSAKDPLQIVVIKGIFSGIGSVIIGLCIGEKITYLWSIPVALSIGFVAYGMSIFFYVHAQRLIGATRTSAYYAVAPFIGVLLSFAIFQQPPHYTYYIGLFLMIIGTFLCFNDKPLFRKTKPKEEEN